MPRSLIQLDDVATLANVIDTFNNLIDLANRRTAVGEVYPRATLWDYEPFPNSVALVIDDEAALQGRTEARACAAAGVDDKNDGTVYIARKLLSFDGEKQRGVLAHELAHVSLLQHGNEDHSEREADAHAKRLFGFTISYDSDDIQTTGPGIAPRPAYLG